MDIFPSTPVVIEAEVDQVGRTARQMTYFLFARVMWRRLFFWVGKIHR